jgi:predicted dehydrogenase
VNAVRANRIAFQTGSQQRSSAEFQLACEIVRNGRIGQLQRVEALIPGGPVTAPEPANPQPDTLDWDLWLGPAPSTAYHQLRAAGTFRYFRDYSGGTITDLGAHELDIAQWGAGRDATGPTTIAGSGRFEPGNFFESPTELDVVYTYDDGLEVRLRNTTGIWSIQFFGTEGEILVALGTLQASRPELLEYELGSGAVALETSRDHHVNWFDAIRDGTVPICDVEIGHRSASLCHLANIAIDTGRTLAFDPTAERFIDDPAADLLLARRYREGW